ncbi:hypothetical protein RV134_190038 [Roseovarius sp. EC-HK134]|nr:hypothetical protein RV134_190038 [Roseovarius sp. EC-HK134]VVS99806.1 hypothetical protein RV420_220145 [Roseovarius sp. EC-SD190]
MAAQRLCNVTAEIEGILPRYRTLITKVLIWIGFTRKRYPPSIYVNSDGSLLTNRNNSWNLFNNLSSLSGMSFSFK